MLQLMERLRPALLSVRFPAVTQPVMSEMDGGGSSGAFSCAPSRTYSLYRCSVARLDSGVNCHCLAPWKVEETLQLIS